MIHNKKAGLSNVLRLMLLLPVISLIACQAMPAKESVAEEKPAATEATPAAAEAATSTAAETSTEAAATPEPAAEPVKELPQSPKIAESCKDEPYTGYEQAARDSIAKGLAATQAETYGVGFRDLDEHKRWTSIHNQLFAKVNQTCQAMSDCAKKNPKKKQEQCAAEAKTFAAWQQLAARFAEKAKQSETTQPPIICSFEPNLDDPKQCFHDLAANVTTVCDSAACKELSNCWNGVGFLEAAITQSKLSCSFVHESLDKCRGYVEAKDRRKAKFEQCKTMQADMNLEVLPPL